MAEELAWPSFAAELSIRVLAITARPPAHSSGSSLDFAPFQEEWQRVSSLGKGAGSAGPSPVLRLTWMLEFAAFQGMVPHTGLMLSAALLYQMGVDLL